MLFTVSFWYVCNAYRKIFYRNRSFGWLNILKFLLYRGCKLLNIIWQIHKIVQLKWFFDKGFKLPSHRFPMLSDPQYNQMLGNPIHNVYKAYSNHAQRQMIMVLSQRFQKWFSDLWWLKENLTQPMRGRESRREMRTFEN